ncbi:hypothetical protein PRUPE_3G045600 [Prunus persica]|uniref:RNA helicase n=2 Tax=Prunus persica TaxID=3760 RepID=A0A251PVG7_PRUPE|nr:hypothetical protein PRUPE_3G045600 [Prunus persica]
MEWSESSDQEQTSGTTVVLASLTGLAIGGSLVAMIGFSILASVALVLLTANITLLLFAVFAFVGAISGFVLVLAMALAGVLMLERMLQKRGGTSLLSFVSETETETLVPQTEIVKKEQVQHENNEQDDMAGLALEEQEDFATFDEVYCDFEYMGLQCNLLRGIFAYGFEKPSASQRRGIVPFCEGLDVIQQAQPGTGKRATFCCGILEQLNIDLVECQALVLAPTRASALKTEKVMLALGDYLGLRVYACVRGRTRHEGQRILHAGVHVVVGTPDCVFEMLSSQNLYPDHIDMIVLDEAGEMLTGSFNDEILHIFQLLPSPVQVGVFSATMPPEVLEVTRKFMTNTKPVRIIVEHDELTLEGIKQFYVNVEEEEWKLDTVCELHDSLSTYPTVIFVDTTHKVEWLTDRMRSLDHTVSAIHVDTDLNTRDTILREFRTGSCTVLITTDHLARCMDVQQARVVVNYDLPNQPENYLHRIGRSGSFGSKSVVINFMIRNEERKVLDIQRFYKLVIEELPADFAHLF